MTVDNIIILPKINRSTNVAFDGNATIIEFKKSNTKHIIPIDIPTEAQQCLIATCSKLLYLAVHNKISNLICFIDDNKNIYVSGAHAGDKNAINNIINNVLNT